MPAGPSPTRWGCAVAELPSEPVLLVEDVGAGPAPDDEPARVPERARPRAASTRPGRTRSRRPAATTRRPVVVLAAAGRAFCAGYDLNEDADEGELDARGWHVSLAAGTGADASKFLDSPQARDRERAVLLPGRRDRPDARVRPRGGRRRRVLRLRRHPVRLRRRVDVPALGRGGPQGEGAAVHGRGPRLRRRGAPDRARQPRRAAR